jgi:hypothetical protein
LRRRTFRSGTRRRGRRLLVLVHGFNAGGEMAGAVGLVAMSVT